MKKIFAVLASVMVLAASGCGDSSEIASTGGGNSTSSIENPVTEQVLWDSENLKVSFMEIFEYDYLKGTCYLKLKVENKSAKTITVYPKDAYVNDTSIVLASGLPMALLPGKQSQTPFFFGYTTLGMESIDEIQKIEFKLWCVDEDFETVEETDSLLVNLP